MVDIDLCFFQVGVWKVSIKVLCSNREMKEPKTEIKRPKTKAQGVFEKHQDRVEKPQ